MAADNDDSAIEGGEVAEEAITPPTAEISIRAARRIGGMLAETVRPGNPQLLHDETIGLDEN